MDLKPYKLYVLVDPRANVPKMRYIGQTKRSLNERLAEHILDSKKAHTHKNHWILQLLNLSLKPTIEELCRYDTLEACNGAEKLFIKHMTNLTNTTAGGIGGVTRKSHVPDELVIKLYNQGLTSHQIAKQQKTCQKRVLSVLHKHGVILRPSAKKAKKA